MKPAPQGYAGQERCPLSGTVEQGGPGPTVRLYQAKYDHDDSSASGGAENNNKHFYMDLEGKMKVGKTWEAHFQSETRKGYTSNQSWRNSASSDDQDGTFQRIWVEGHPGALGVTVGTKWWGYGFQCVPFGHAADGAQIDVNFAKTWNAKAFLPASASGRPGLDAG